MRQLDGGVHALRISLSRVLPWVIFLRAQAELCDFHVYVHVVIWLSSYESIPGLLSSQFRNTAASLVFPKRPGSSSVKSGLLFEDDE